MASKIYITKAKFDKEFELYQQLSRTFFLMIGYEDTELQISTNKFNFKEAQVTMVEVQESIYSYASFITKDFYESYTRILQECKGLLTLYNPEKNPKINSFQNMKNIIKMFEKLNEQLRLYLSKLEVIGER